MRIKGVFYVAIIAILALGCVVALSEAASKYSATVNGVGIKNTSLDAAMDNFIENQKMMGVDIKEEDKDRLRSDILEELISAELLYQESKKAGLGDLSKDIQEQFDLIKKGFSSEEEFKKLLKDRGITEADLKEDIKKGIYINKFLEKDVYNNILITEADKIQEYEKNKDKLDVPEYVRASHILIRTAPDATEEQKNAAKEKIEGLRKRALGGEDFATLAKENSEDTSAPNGGDIGYFRMGDMVKPFEDAAFAMEKEEISKVVETQFGYHIIKLTDKRAAHTLTYNEVEKDIGRFLLNDRKREALSKFVDDLKKSAKIKIY